jgi:hypothetical protein
MFDLLTGVPTCIEHEKLAFERKWYPGGAAQSRRCSSVPAFESSIAGFLISFTEV